MTNPQAPLRADFTYYDDLGDRRLKTIRYQSSGGSNLGAWEMGYSSNGLITSIKPPGTSDSTVSQR